MLTKHADITNQILKSAINVHKNLGPGFVEKVYQIAQIISYLKAANIEVGLILNFAKPRLEIKRVVL